MDAFLTDLRHAARLFLRTPSFTFTAIAALALGIGASTAIFSVVNTVLLKPFAFPDPERVVLFENTFPQGRSGSAAPAEFNWWRPRTGAFEDVSAYAFGVANLTGDAFPKQLPAMRVSADFFRLAGANPLLGRTFTAEDDLPNAPKTTVLARSFWQQRFAADPSVIGKSITLVGEPHEIIGVAGADLEAGQISEQSLGSGDIEVNDPPDVYLPFQLDPASTSLSHFFNVAGRLKPGVTLAAANAQLRAGYPDYSRTSNDFTPGKGFAVRPLRAALVAAVRRPLLILLSAVSLVLLIACANVANLLLARASGRKAEFAIRAAVGAGRARLARQVLTESLVLSFAGGAFGLALGYAAIRCILALGPANIPRIGASGANVNLDWRLLSFTFALSILTGILFGLAPALQADTSLAGALNKSGARGGAGFRQNRARALLVTAETTLAFVLLIGAALLIRSFIATRQVDPGFDSHNVVTMRMSLAGPQFPTPASVARLIHDGARRLNALPGVEVAGSASGVPLEDRFGQAFKIVGRDVGANGQGLTGWTLVSPGYFEAFRIPLVRGRLFAEPDDNGPPVAIINQTLARRFWPDGDPLNGQIILGDQPPRLILGVVGDVRDDTLNRLPRPNMYIPAAQMADTSLLADVPWAWVIRTHAEPTLLASAIRDQLRLASGGLPVARVRSMEESVSRSTAVADFNTVLLTSFGCVALVLAAIGIYGLMAYSVAQRTREIGIRLALGAESNRIRTMVMFQGLRPALVGVALGLVAALGLARLITSLLFGVEAWDPVAFVVVPLLLLAVAFLAVWLPATRASRIDPARMLGSD